jgi:hypothetical protein
MWMSVGISRAALPLSKSPHPPLLLAGEQFEETKEILISA